MPYTLDEIDAMTPEVFKEISDRTVEDWSKSENPRPLTMDEIDAMPRNRDIIISEKMAEITDEDLAGWELKGKIGVAERWRREDKTEMIPLNPESAVKKLNLLDAVRRTINPDHVPYLSQLGISQAFGPYGVATGEKVLETFKREPTEEQLGKDMELLSNYIIKAEEERVRGYTLPAKVMKGVIELPSYMAAFFLTGPVSATVKGATKVAISKAIKKGIQTKVGKLATSAVANLTAQAARTAVGFQPTAIENYADRQINAHLELTDNGIKIVKEGSETPVKSAFKAYLETYIEVFSETLGPTLTGVPSKAIGYISPRAQKALTKSLSKLYLKLNPNKTARDLFTKAGITSFLDEMTEEQAASFLMALTGVQDFGAADPENTMDRVWASLPGAEELLTQGLVLAFPVGARMGISQSVDLIRSRRRRAEEKEIELNEISDEQINEIAEEVITPVEPERVTEIEKQVAEGKPIEQAIEEVVGDEFSQEVKDSLADQYEELAAEPVKEEEGLAEVSELEEEMTPEEIEEGLAEFDPDEIHFVQQAMSIGAEGIKIPKSTIVKAAREIRDDLNEQLDTEPEEVSSVEQFVLDNGGIRAFKGGEEKEEYTGIPKRFRKKSGRPLDEMAENIDEEGIVPGMTSEDLRQELIRIGEKKKPAKKIRIKDMLGEGEKAARLQRQFYARVMPGIKQTMREKTGQFKGEPTVVELTALNAVMKAQARAAATSRKMTLEEVKQTQNAVIIAIEKSGLPAEEKIKFLRTIKALNTREKLIGGLPRLVERIGGRRVVVERKELIEEINDELKTTKITKPSGRPKSKFVAEFQAVLDNVRKAVRMDRVDAEVVVARNLEQYQGGNMPANISTENMILNEFSGIESMSNNELTGILGSIRNIKAGGKKARELVDTNRAVKKEAAVLMTLNEFIGDGNLNKSAATVGITDVSKERPTISMIKTFLRNLIFSWNDLMSSISVNSKAAPGESFIEKFADVFNETRNEQAAIAYFSLDIRKMVEESYGVTSEGDVLDILRGSNIRHMLGDLTNLKNETAPFWITKAQARKKWMELQDPTLRETFVSEDGMAWSPEHIAAIEKLLTPQDKKFALAQLQFYRDFYTQINEVYKDIYKVDLPFNEFYSPIKRTDIDTRKISGFGEFMQEIVKRAHLTSQSFKTRQRSIKPLEFTSDTEVLQNHFIEMNRFVHWARKIRDLHDVFDDPRIKQAIAEKYGSQFGVSVSKFINNFTRGGTDKANVSRFMDQWRIRVTHAAVGFRPVIAIKQLASTPAYLEHLSPAEFAAGVADFWTDPIHNFNILKKSKFFKFRGRNIERDLRDALKSDAYGAFKEKDSFVNRLMLNVKFGDQAAIAVGGWAVYRSEIKKGKTSEQALDKFARISNAAQQSADLAEQSLFQQESSLSKLFTMFLTVPAQYNRRIIGAVRNYKAGRIGAAQAAKTVILYHVILPMIFQWLSDFGKFKPKEQLRAAIIGNLNGIFIVAEYLDAIVRQGLEMRQFPKELPIMTTPWNDLQDAMRILDIDDIGDEDFWLAIKGGVGLAGFFTKIQLREAIEMLEGLPEIYEGNYRDGTGALMGWSEYALREDKKKYKLR